MWSAAVITGWDERQPDDARRARSASHQEVERRVLLGMGGGIDVAHCDWPPDRGAEAPAGHFSQPVPGVVDNLGFFARRRAAVRTDADALAAGSLGELPQYRGGAREAAFLAPSLADRPDEIGLDRGRGFIDVVPIEAESCLEAQRIAGAQAD